MVTCRLVGGLGNQMFQIATTIAHALKNNTEYKIPEMTMNNRIWKSYFKNLPKLTTNDKIECTYQERGHPYQNIPFAENMCISGYFQSEKYFIPYRNEILRAFGFKWKLNKGVVSIHVRRGDYLEFQGRFPVITNEYISKAIEHFSKLKYKKYLVFSDDIDWCKENINKKKYPSCKFEYSEGKSEIKDIELMSNCEHNIIANSSFSWWGAWLGQNKNKIVVAPKTWFGAENFHLNTKDIVPSTWIKM